MVTNHKLTQIKLSSNNIQYCLIIPYKYEINKKVVVIKQIREPHTVIGEECHNITNYCIQLTNL